MKKTMLTIAMATLCLFFKTSAQTLTKPVDRIAIGQKVPDVVIQNLHNYKSKTAKLSDFAGKLLIIDFWATWCKPCLMARSKMEGLQQQFDGKLQFLAVTYQDEKEVIPFMKKFNKGRKMLIPEVMSDQLLHDLFPHTYMPHYVWIDQEGIVRAITGDEEVTAINVQKLLGSKVGVVLKEKNDLTADGKLPTEHIVNADEEHKNNILYASWFSRLRKDLIPVEKKYKEHDKVVKYSGINLPIEWFARYAYSKDTLYLGKNRILLEVKDSTKLFKDNTVDYSKWSEDNAYCYEIYVAEKSPLDLRAQMKVELNAMFPQYKFSLEKRRVKCLVLVQTSDQEKFKTKGGTYSAKVTPMECKVTNGSIHELLSRLKVIYLHGNPHPIINEIKYDKNVDLDLECNMGNVESINGALAKYDLKFIIAERVTDMMIVRDSL